MKKNKKVRVDDLFLEVVEYAFVEWLVRRGLFTAFRSNFDYIRTPKMSFRDCLREHIRFVHRCLSLDSLISSAFFFTSTPEGYEFWLKQSNDWKRFFSKFTINL